MTFAPAALAAWEPSQRYPDPAVQSLDPSFNKYQLALAGVERLATGCRFNEASAHRRAKQLFRRRGTAPTRCFR
jgi:hypothetical protein